MANPLVNHMFGVRVQTRSAQLHWMRGLVRIAGLSMVVASLFHISAVRSEVYVSSPSFEISGSGSRLSRNCTVSLRPVQTLGDGMAPQLTLATSGVSRLTVATEKSSLYSDITLVRDNVRSAFPDLANVSTERFAASEVSASLKSRRVFFVTAKRADSGKYVSSRYEAIDFDGLLTRLETHCPFDAESLIADLSSRERAETALATSAADMRLIRWALGKRFAGASAEPDSRSVLSSTERDYLKRFASEIGLPISRFLTSETARRLTAEGRTLATAAAPAVVPTRVNPVSVNRDRKPFWSFEGSTLELKADKGSRQFVLDRPAGEMQRLGATPGATVFRGSRSKNAYQGSAYAFWPGCSPMPFTVTGVISEDQREVTLYGDAPQRNAACRVTGSRSQTLRLVFHDEADNFGEGRR